MKTLTEEQLTRAAIARLSECRDARLREIIASLIRHLHEFAREVELTPDEWFTGIQFRTDLGHITADGPVGKMLKALARHPYRPAHIHFMIAAPGYKTLTTALYIAGDPYLNSDAVFGAKQSLVVSYNKPVDGSSPDTIDFAFVLSSSS